MKKPNAVYNGWLAQNEEEEKGYIRKKEMFELSWKN